MSTVALILARGGSKGIPNKNLTEVNGKPLIYYTINAALNAKIDGVWVSTDSENIARYSLSLGASFFKRPLKYATDTSKSEEALIHFCESFNFDNIVFIQPTSPLLKTEDINNGLEIFKDYDSVFSGFISHWLPTWSYNKDENRPLGWDIENRPRRQDVPPVVIENGSFYISSRKRILESGQRYSGKIGYYLMNPSDSFQVDSYDDLRIIKHMLSEVKNE